MDETQSSNKLELDYEAAKGIALSLLVQTQQDLLNENYRIKEDIEDKDAFPAQLDDYVYNNRVLESVTLILEYFGYHK